MYGGRASSAYPGAPTNLIQLLIDNALRRTFGSNEISPAMVESGEVDATPRSPIPGLRQPVANVPLGLQPPNIGVGR